MGLTRDASEFIVGTRLDDIPDDVRHLARRSILDGLGLAVAGARSRPAEICRAEIASYGHLASEASVLGSGITLPARFAAFLNGLAIHADDFDDTQLATAPDRVYGLLTHPTAPVLPAVLALAERDGRDGADALLAYLVGVEVETKISEAMNPRHYEHGFHSTATVGAIGSAAASAQLLGLDVNQTRTALGIAASQAAGLRENFGTMTKPFHAGRAAESGLLAASLAQRGFTAADNILEADRGFFRAAGGGYDPDLIVGALGQPWTFRAPGVSIKPHPSGSLTHPAMDAVLKLVVEYDLRPEEVRSIRIGTNRHMPNALIHHRPTDSFAAKFSMEFCVAILILERRAGLPEFTDEVVNRPDVQDMIGRVRFESDPAAETRGFREMTSLVDLELTTGAILHAAADFGKGSPANPMSDAELVDKFLSCLDWAGVDSTIGRTVATRVLDLDAEPRLGTLVAELRPSPTLAR